MNRRPLKRWCNCGCGEIVVKFYAQGHDQRHLQAVIKRNLPQEQALREFPTKAMRDRYLREVNDNGVH